jgi:hypothetical protein
MTGTEFTSLIHSPGSVRKFAGGELSGARRHPLRCEENVRVQSFLVCSPARKTLDPTCGFLWAS